jgi:hypothetical protein
VGKENAKRRIKNSGAVIPWISDVVVWLVFMDIPLTQ